MDIGIKQKGDLILCMNENPISMKELYFIACLISTHKIHVNFLTLIMMN